jgi:beta-glucosidase/6-phospho-beta-glucosidase/beta-galactosidase
VATSAYQSEGGYNGAGEPQTNWAAAEAAGAVDRLGRAADFWRHYPEDLATCRRLGLNAIRLGIEWSRVQPAYGDGKAAPPEFDRAALDRYGDMLLQCRVQGLEPVLTLHHFVHPAWLGADAWLEESTVGHFEAYVRTAVSHVNRFLTARGQPPVRYYLTVNEPNMLVLNTYLGHQFPSRAGRGPGRALAALGRLLAAHIRAYNAVHDVHQQEAWEAPRVSLNNYCSDIYWCDKLLLDLLCIRHRGVADGAVQAYLRERSVRFEQALRHCRIPLRRDAAALAGSLVRWLFHRLGRHRFDPAMLDGFAEALRQSPRSKLLDFVALDYYDPFAAHAFRWPVWWDHEFHSKSLRAWMMNAVTSKWWDWIVLPQGMHFFCQYYSEDLGGLPVLIAENGMAVRRRADNTYSHRNDRMTRSEFIRMHGAEVVRIVAEGIPLFGYLHWSLFDNYEWGTYTPRFGLYSLDYRNGTERFECDHLDDRASAAYADVVAEARRSGGRV